MFSPPVQGSAGSDLGAERVLRVGLTGGIATGKSRVLARLARTGARTLDLDEVAHGLLGPGGAAVADVQAAFGNDVLGATGGIDRKRLGALVFADVAARRRLNALMHPRILDKEARCFGSLEPGARGVFVTDGALLIESGRHLRFDRIVLVDCPEEEQLQRLAVRDGLDRTAARARLDAQLPGVAKRPFAHFVIDTSGSVEQTDEQADALAGQLHAVARTPVPQPALSLEKAAGCILHGPAAGPRGLAPLTLLALLVDRRELELERLARDLVPAAAGPWYEAARREEAGSGPETLAGALTLWATAHRGLDREYLAGAALSLAHLTHASPGAAATALAYAGLFQAAAEVSEEDGPLAERLAQGAAWAAERTGQPTHRTVAATLDAVAAHPRDVAATRAAARSTGGHAALAAGLAGLLRGVPRAAVPEELRRLLLAVGYDG